jgi:hypothetical protein
MREWGRRLSKVKFHRRLGGGKFSDQYSASLYNLREDIAEETNLSRTKAERLSALSELLDRWEAEMAESTH